ncbi:glycerol kinase GlpK [Desulfovibrio sp. OttesenSCG-928-I05]|nr:glycerol kinase GlpK [Desulfovibrio sp. OttesenSCG-928-I05]
MKRYILALDQGTTSSRAILFDHAGMPVSTAQKEFPQIFPRPGWVEHDPQTIWATQVGVAGEVLAQARVPFSSIAAIGITNQRETTIIWDKNTGEPVYNAIVWQDRRTASVCDTLVRNGHADMIRKKTGLIPDAYFSGTKAAWILDSVEGARARAEKGELLFGTVDTWLLWQLTAGRVHATDPSNASRTMLYNINTNSWDDELLELIGVPRAMLPEVRPSGGVFGETDPAVYGATIPIAGIAGDQQAATYGQACHKPGMAKNTYGTGCFMLLNTGSSPVLSENKLLTTVGWRCGEGETVYALEGSVFIAGAAVQWLRDGLGIIKSSSEVEQLALTVPDNGGLYLVPAFTGIGAPHWDPYARGAMLGITRGTTAAHLARATLESIAFQAAGVLSAMQEDAKNPLTELRVDGGASTNNLLMQFQADILNLPVVRPKVTETTALGAAYLAGLSTGFWESEEEIAAQWQEDARFTPSMASDRREELLANWQKAVARSLAWEETE